MAYRDTVQSRKVHDYVAAGVATTIMLGVVISTTYILIWPIPETNQTLVGQIQGSLWTALGVVLAYYYGRNKSDTEKDETINAMATTARMVQGNAPDKVVEVDKGESVVVRGEDDG